MCLFSSLSFLKQKLSPIMDPPIFSFSCQLPLSFSLAYLLRDNTGIGEVTHGLFATCSQPRPYPAGIFPGSLCFLIGRHSVTVLLQSLLTGIHLVIMLLLYLVTYSVLVFPRVSFHGYSFYLSIAGISADW